jgi:hypothetical protein
MFSLYPTNKFLDIGMGQQFFDRVELSLQLFFSEQGVQLIVTRAADWDGDVAVLPHLSFHFFVVAHPGN